MPRTPRRPRPYNAVLVSAILARVYRHHLADGLSMGLFVEAFIEIEQALGDGIEADGVEALINYALNDSWIEAAEAALARRRRQRPTGGA